MVSFIGQYAREQDKLPEAEERWGGRGFRGGKPLVGGKIKSPSEESLSEETFSRMQACRYDPHTS